MLQSLCTSFTGDPVSAIALGPMSLRAETVFDLPELKFGIISFAVYFYILKCLFKHRNNGVGKKQDV